MGKECHELTTSIIAWGVPPNINTNLAGFGLSSVKRIVRFCGRKDDGAVAATHVQYIYISAREIVFPLPVSRTTCFLVLFGLSEAMPQKIWIHRTRKKVISSFAGLLDKFQSKAAR